MCVYVYIYICHTQAHLNDYYIIQCNVLPRHALQAERLYDASKLQSEEGAPAAFAARQGRCKALCLGTRPVAQLQALMCTSQEILLARLHVSVTLRN